MPTAKTLTKARVALVSLGCPKNLVDSEVLIGRLANESIDIVLDPADADIAFVNTCGFIDAAREESTHAIDELIGLKKQGRLSGVVVTGCMVKLFRDRLEKSFPDVDAFLDISDYSDAPKAVQGILRGRDVRHLKGGQVKEGGTDLGRALLTPEHFAYVRVSEGCNYKCSFCIIPQIRGRHKSKPVSSLEDEVRQLASLGVREISLVGEDSTMYGRDLSGNKGPVGLVSLLESLSAIDGIDWIRVLYTHPLSFEDRLVDVLRDNPKVLPYIDMPLQHINDSMLKAMKRGTPRSMIESRIATLRDGVPGITLRTTMIVGFPGETDEAFEELMEFLGEVKFERLGCFTYSPEESSTAAPLGDDIPRELKLERQSRVMEQQKGIVEDRNRSLIGSIQNVILDTEYAGASSLESSGSGETLETRSSGKTRFIGRTEADNPEIDCAIHLEGEGEPGQIRRATIRGYDGYDLIGELVSESN